MLDGLKEQVLISKLEMDLNELFMKWARESGVYEECGRMMYEAKDRDGISIELQKPVFLGMFKDMRREFFTRGWEYCKEKYGL